MIWLIGNSNNRHSTVLTCLSSQASVLLIQNVSLPGGKGGRNLKTIACILCRHPNASCRLLLLSSLYVSCLGVWTQVRLYLSHYKLKMAFLLNVNARSNRKLFRSVLGSNVELHIINGTYIDTCPRPHKPCEGYFDWSIQIYSDNDALIILR
jgi:hypothetical protein